ncbi:MAG: CoA-binding protein [Rhodospirillaceae bacterium]|nr:CoA-binding protein [Rhodospirillaceae bacterium]
MNDNKNENDDLIVGILESVKTIALVGASANSSRPSHGVMQYLLANGYTVYPVNPGLAGGELLGQTVYASIADVPSPCDMVDIFRKSEDAGKVCSEAIDLAPEKGFQVIWMQLGISNNAAAEQARDAGMVVIEDKCVKIEHDRLMR